MTNDIPLSHTDGPPSQRHLTLLIAVATLILVATSCTDSTSSEGTAHPTPKNRVFPRASVATRDSLPAHLAGVELDQWVTVRNRLSNARTTVRIGTKGPGPAMFGSVSDAKIDHAGHIHVFDEQAQTVSVFDQQGRYVTRFGGLGDGPQELRQASRLSILEDGRVAVPTLPSTLKIFGPTDDSTWELEQQIDLPTGATGICSMSNSSLLLSGWARTGNTILHYLALPALDVTSFGTGYDDDEWIVRWWMSDGLVGCVNGTIQLAIFGFQILPLINAYTLDGAIQWRSRIEGHIPMTVVSRVRPDGRTGISRSRATPHDLLGFIQGHGNHVILQYDRFLPDDRSVTRQTFLLDARNGHGALLSDTLPTITSVHSNGYVAVFEDPYPRVEYRVFSTSRSSS